MTRLIAILLLVASACHAAGPWDVPHVGSLTPAASAPAVWTPTNLDSIALWLNASNNVTTNASGAVTNWVDTTANAFAFTNVSSTTSPTLLCPGVVKFDGVDDFMLSANLFQLKSNLTIIAVLTNVIYANALRAADNTYTVGWWLGVTAENTVTKFGGGYQAANDPFGSYVTVRSNYFFVMLNVSNGTTTAWGLTNSGTPYSRVPAAEAGKVISLGKSDTSDHFGNLGIKCLIVRSNCISDITNIVNVRNWASNTYSLSP